MQRSAMESKVKRNWAMHLINMHVQHVYHNLLIYFRKFLLYEDAAQFILSRCGDQKGGRGGASKKEKY